jgi:hypothetical protein
LGLLCFNAIFNNISVISWRSVLLVQEYPEKITDLPQVTVVIVVAIMYYGNLKYIWGLSWSYSSWIYNYLCNQCLSPLKLLVQTLFMARCVWYNIMW